MIVFRITVGDIITAVLVGVCVLAYGFFWVMAKLDERKRRR